MCGGITSPSELITPKTMTVFGNLVFITLGTSLGHIAIHRWFCLLWAWSWQKFFSSEKNHSMLDSFRCFSLLRSLVELSRLLSLVAWVESWPNLHSVAFAVQILVYTSLNYPFIKPQFSSHGSHGLGGVNVDHGLNPFDKICTSRLLAVVQRL